MEEVVQLALLVALLDAFGFVFGDAVGRMGKGVGVEDIEKEGDEEQDLRYLRHPFHPYSLIWPWP